MIPALLPLIRQLLGDQADSIARDQLKALLLQQRGPIVRKAARRLERDGAVAKILEPGPHADKDGEALTGREWFLHEALYQIAKAAGLPGELADVFRDRYFTKLRPEAEALLAARMPLTAVEATERVFARVVEVLL